MLGCAQCKQFGFLNLPFESRRFRRMLERRHTSWDTFHNIVYEWIYPRSPIEVCDCCGDGEEWYFEPGIHYTTGECRPGERRSPADAILIRNEIHPLYWEFLKTGDRRYYFDLAIGNSYHLCPGGTAWKRAISELAALKEPQTTLGSATIPRSRLIMSFADRMAHPTRWPNCWPFVGLQ
jgi:hypothetical protein